MTRHPRQRVEVVELDERDRQLLARRHPELVGHRAAVVVAGRADLRRRLLDAIGHVARTVNDGERVLVERLVALLLPPTDVPSPRLLEQARREALFRTRVMRDFGAMRATELADRAGAQSANRSQLAYRWRTQRRIFGVDHRGDVRYPGFQFDERGQPLPVVADVLDALGAGDGWDLVRWFVSPHQLLDLRRPVDLLAAEPSAVAAAARHDGGRAPRG